MFKCQGLTLSMMLSYSSIRRSRELSMNRLLRFRDCMLENGCNMQNGNTHYLSLKEDEIFSKEQFWSCLIKSLCGSGILT